MIYTRNECCSLPFCLLKIVRFSCKDKSENTFKYVCLGHKVLSKSKGRNFFATNKHSRWNIASKYSICMPYAVCSEAGGKRCCIGCAVIRERDCPSASPNSESRRGTPCHSLDLRQRRPRTTATKDERIVEQRGQIKVLQSPKANMQQLHNQELAKLTNGYQAEIEKAVKETESLRKAI